jgi:hypothetical protein
MTAALVGDVLPIERNEGKVSILAVVEMNLEEYPAFRLGRRSKRPELRYTRARTEPDGRSIEQLWIVRGAEGLGLPGPFEQDLYVALLVLFTEQGLPSDGRIRFTRNRLAQLMEVSNSGRGYELIEQGLTRLAGASVHTEHAFYRPAAMAADSKRGGPTERLSLDFHILEEVRVYERRAAVAVFEDEDSAEVDELASAGAKRMPRIEPARPFEVSVARLGLPLVQSYERRYTKPLDATFYFSLTRPLAKRLYRYVDKVRNGRGSFEIGIRPLADVLGLEYRYPSDIKDGLVEAHAELIAHGFLGTAEYAPLAGGPGAGEKVMYAFNAEFDQRPRRRAGAALHVVPSAGALTASTPARVAAADTPTPAMAAAVTSVPPSPDAAPEVLAGKSARPALALVKAPAKPVGSADAVPSATAIPSKKSLSPALKAELEAFGISPSRAAALVAQFPEGHVRARMEYVRALLETPERRTSGSGGGSRLRNPAGYLARAIEESYAVPAAAPAAPMTTSGSSTPQAQSASAASAGQLAPPERSDSGASASASSGPVEPEDAEVLPEGPWGDLLRALRSSLTGATYAAWIRPANLGDAQEAGTITVKLPSTYALDRWHRPPISGALAQAAATLGLTVTLEVSTEV